VGREAEPSREIHHAAFGVRRVAGEERVGSATGHLGIGHDFCTEMVEALHNRDTGTFEGTVAGSRTPNLTSTPTARMRAARAVPTVPAPMTATRLLMKTLLL
jgi:hypothetical protein